MKRLLLILLLTAPAQAVNFFASDSDIALLLRFESADSIALNSAHSADGTKTLVDLNTTLEKEGVGCVNFDDGFTGDITITHANQPTKLFDGSDFTICGWFRLETLTNLTLLNQGTAGSNLSVKLAVYDAGATESIRLSLGYGDGTTTDTYTHASDLSVDTWYWVGVTVDTDGNVRIRIYQDGVGALGTDINTATLHTYLANSQSVVIGDYFDGFMDELAVFDRALDVGELDAVRAGTFNTSAGPFSFYCSPTGSNRRLGTSALPWGAFGDLEADNILGVYVNEGDTVYLQDGYHGYIGWSDATDTERQYTNWVTIKSVAAAQPTFSGMNLGGTRYLKFDGSDASSGYIKVSPEYAGTVSRTNPGTRPTIIYCGNSTGAEYIYFSYVDVFTVDDSSGWDAVDWTDITRLGFRCYIDNLTITHCRIRNVQAGITGPKHNFTCTYTTINGFSDNGIETGGYDNQSITNNRIVDCYSFDEATLDSYGAGDFHPDCVQISGSAMAENLNVSYNYINTAVDPTRTQKGWAQGLFLTSDIDGGVVQNNVIMVQNAANACTFGYGATVSDPDGRYIADLLIANNTIIPPDGHGGELYIRFQGNEVGTRDNIDIINNFYHNAPGDSASSSFTYHSNLDADDYTFTSEFVSYATGDVNLVSTSLLINQGTSTLNAPTDDLSGNSRDASPDVGAYEFDGTPSTDPPDAAYNPSPADDATGVAVAPTLSWTVDGYTDDVDVYFGTVSGSLSSIGNQETWTYAPGTLNYSIEYFWRIDANNAYGTTTGTEWSFTVMDEPATPTTNNFAADANCVALWSLETGALTTDSIGTNTLSNLGVVASSVAHKEKGASGLWDTSDGDDYLVISDASLDAGFPYKSGDTTEKISVCCWVYFDTNPTAGLQFIWTKWSDVKKSITLFANNADGFRLGTGDGALGYEEHMDHGTAIVVGRWYHVGVTYQDSDKAYRVRVWDDTLQSVSEITGTATDNTGPCDEPWTLGSDADQEDSLDGRLDEVAVFNDVLSAAEIDQIRQGIYKVTEAEAEGAGIRRYIIMSFD